jgi:hypothetical protein
VSEGQTRQSYRTVLWVTTAIAQALLSTSKVPVRPTMAHYRSEAPVAMVLTNLVMWSQRG